MSGIFGGGGGGYRGPDPSIAANQKRERERLDAEKAAANKKIQARSTARRGGSRMLLNSLSGGTADMTDPNYMSDKLGGSDT
jgi:hypothetical protein